MRVSLVPHISITATLTRKNGNVVFSASGDRPGSAGYGGQCQSTIAADLLMRPNVVFAEGWNAERLERALTLWERWHLNDMRPDCEHQRTEEWASRPIDPNKPTNAYGRHFEGQKYDSWNLLGWVRRTEHPLGLLLHPCSTCGYAYGSDWQVEHIPDYALAEICKVFELSIPTE